MFRALWISLLFVATAAHAARPDLAAGGAHGIALGTDGLVRTWGADTAGQLGLGSKGSTATPESVQNLAGITAVSAGCNHVLALKSDGTVLAWGDNSSGQLGDGSSTDRSIPGPVVQLTDVIAVSAGCLHSAALKRNGTVWSWGAGYNGQLGDGTNTAARGTPVAATGVTNAVAIAAGRAHTAMLASDGTVWSWGLSLSGQLGNGQAPNQAPAFVATRVQALGLASVVAIAAGGDFSLALRSDNTVWSWGGNGYMTLGIPIGPAARSTPAPIPGMVNVSAIAAGETHSLAARRDGTVVAWGHNESGQLGDGTFTVSRLPAAVPGLSGVQSVAAGYAHSLAIKADGSVWAWGDNRFGELGEGSFVHRALPTQIPALAGVRSLDGGGSGSGLFQVASANSIAARSDGSVLAWGSNSEGQLGNGSTPRRSTPSVVATLANVNAIAAGADHSLALRGDGVALAWGSNTYGQLGDGSASNRSAPVGVALPAAATEVTAGIAHSAAILADRTLWTWGNNQTGQLGDGTRLARLTPVYSGLSDVVAVAGGAGHTIATRRDGSLWTWGGNTFGALGLGDRNLRDRPTPTNFGGAVAVAADGEVSTVLRSDGTVWTFGLVGVIPGPGNVYDYLLPEPVTGLTDVIAISARTALKRDGTAWRWRPDGLLNPASAQRRKIVALPIEGFVGAAGISRGVGGTRLARRPDGSVIAAGGNSFGQLGDGTFLDRQLPVVVLRENGEGSIETNDWFLDLDPAVAAAIPSDQSPVFLAVARDSGGGISADLRFRAADVGTQGSVYAFALAPADIVRPVAGPVDPVPTGLKAKTHDGKDTAVACVLAQLTASGQLQQVSASSLQAFVTGVLGAQGQSVAVLGGTNAVNIGGATFFVGYGPNAQAMINGGINRGVVSIPGAKECKPQAPQTGWWWYPPQDGRGYSIEVQGNKIFFAAFLYDTSGRSNWYVATGTTSLDGSLFTGDLLSVKNGQTLFGTYQAPNPITSVGPITLAFSSAASGSMVWPGGTVPLERFNIVPNGLNITPQDNLPETGWWWNPAESGRGFFIEWQGGKADLAGYMYDDAGEPVWYLTVQSTPDPRRFAGNWWTFADGQTLLGAWKPNRQTSDNFAPVSIQFHTRETATLTLPGGRTTPLVRHRF